MDARRSPFRRHNHQDSTRDKMASSSRLSRSALSTLVSCGNERSLSAVMGEASTSYGLYRRESVRRSEEVGGTWTRRSNQGRLYKSTARLTARANDAFEASSHASRQSSRPFSTTVHQRSAWPAGTDVPSVAANKGMMSPETTLPPSERAITVRDIRDKKLRGEPIAVLTAYDYSSALSQRAAAVDICLVGDSLANVALGHRTTHTLSLDAMIHHVQAVARGLRHPTLNAPDVPPVPLLIADVPYGCGVEMSVEEGVRAATRLVKEGGADGVKIEGSLEVVPLVERLTAFGIPVMAHVGLQPQRAASGSALSLASRTADEAMQTLAVTRVLESAGAFSTVLEAVPARVGAAIAEQVRIPVIGIGAGSGTDGQVLVADDVLGECSSPLHVLSSLRGIYRPETAQRPASSQEAASAPSAARALQPPGPRFVRNFAAEVTHGASLGAIRIKAVQAYVSAVKARTFPSNEDEAYKMKREEWARFKEMLEAA